MLNEQQRLKIATEASGDLSNDGVTGISEIYTALGEEGPRAIEVKLASSTI